MGPPDQHPVANEFRFPPTDARRRPASQRRRFAIRRDEAYELWNNRRASGCHRLAVGMTRVLLHLPALRVSVLPVAAPATKANGATPTPSCRRLWVARRPAFPCRTPRRFPSQPLAFAWTT